MGGKVHSDSLKHLSEMLWQRAVEGIFDNEKELWTDFINTIAPLSLNSVLWKLSDDLSLHPVLMNTGQVSSKLRIARAQWTKYSHNSHFDESTGIADSFMAEHALKRMIAFPLRADGSIQGLITFFADSAFSEDQIEILRLFVRLYLITCLKIRSDSEIHQKQQWLKGIADSFPDMLFVVDDSLRIIFSNDKTLDGLSAIPGKKIEEIFPETISESLGKDIEKALKDGQIIEATGQQKTTKITPLSSDRALVTISSKTAIPSSKWYSDGCETLVLEHREGFIRYCFDGEKTTDIAGKSIEEVIDLSADRTEAVFEGKNYRCHFFENTIVLTGIVSDNLARKYRDLTRTLARSKSEKELVEILFSKLRAIKGIRRCYLGLSSTVKANFESEDNAPLPLDYIRKITAKGNIIILDKDNPVFSGSKVAIVDINDKNKSIGFLVLEVGDDISQNIALTEILGELGTDIGFALRNAELEKENSLITAQLLKTRKLETVSTLAGGIAHDFNNILTPILGFADLLLMEKEDNPKYFRYLKQIVGAAERAKKLVNQVLIFSRQIDQDFHSIDLGDTISETVNLLRAYLSDKVSLEFIQTESPLEINGNSAQLNQILIHIFNNAVSSFKGKSGEIRIELRKKQIDRDLLRKHPNLKIGSYAMLSVEDNGIGMGSQTLERAFDPFFTTKPVGEGSGMGLPVVHGIVTSHEGAIEIESTEGQGTKVMMYFPEKSSEYSGEYISSSQGNRERILLVDDESNVTFVLNEMLTKLGYNVSIRDTGEGALELFERDPEYFDLVITDQAMPGMTGIDLIISIKKIRSNIPTVIITGYSDSTAKEKGRKAGIDAYVMKPVVIKELAEVIRNALDRK